MTHMNDNDNGLSSDQKLKDAFYVNEFLSNCHANYPELQESDLWQDIIQFAGGRYCEIQDMIALRHD